MGNCFGRGNCKGNNHSHHLRLLSNSSPNRRRLCLICTRCDSRALGDGDDNQGVGICRCTSRGDDGRDNPVKKRRSQVRRVSTAANACFSGCNALRNFREINLPVGVGVALVRVGSCDGCEGDEG